MTPDLDAEDVEDAERTKRLLETADRDAKDAERIKLLLARFAAAEAAGLPASTVNGCPCDFCTGAKKYDDNWCFRCANVRMQPPKWWENADVCDQCEREMEIERAAEAASP